MDSVARMPPSCSAVSTRNVIPATIQTPWALILFLLSIKLLLIPSYRSTDFDVHRLCLAITRSLPLREWYKYDSFIDPSTNQTVVTSHTLDYPPTFALFEYFLANTYATTLVDNECFDMYISDEDSRAVGYDCVVFQRCTVIFVGDLFLLIGAWLLSRVYFSVSLTNTVDTNAIESFQAMVSFSLVIGNSGLLLLDHIHFQYNGMCLGILLISLACLIRGMDETTGRAKCQEATVSSSCVWEMIGGLIFAALLTVKHLYITLVPIYLCYLFRKFCFIEHHFEDERRVLVFSWKRLLSLGSGVIVTLMLPFIPFLINWSFQDSVPQSDWQQTISEILSRMFPWERGLVHEYWAGNVWALLLFIEKITRYTKMVILGISTGDRYRIVDCISPGISTLCVFLALTPSLQCTWHVASARHIHVRARKDAFLYCICYTSLTVFLLGYHIHEKMIMTCILPMTFIGVVSSEGAQIYMRLATLGIFGLLPLLHNPKDIFLKGTLFCVQLCSTFYCIKAMGDWRSAYNQRDEYGKSVRHEVSEVSWIRSAWKLSLSTSNADYKAVGIMMLILLYSEVIHPTLCGLSCMEFLPLMTISVFCSVGFITCWLQCGRFLLEASSALVNIT